MDFLSWMILEGSGASIFSNYVKEPTISICDRSQQGNHILDGGFLGNGTAPEPVIC